jgi:hypothetical protein
MDTIFYIFWRNPMISNFKIYYIAIIATITIIANYAMEKEYTPFGGNYNPTLLNEQPQELLQKYMQDIADCQVIADKLTLEWNKQDQKAQLKKDKLKYLLEKKLNTIESKKQNDIDIIKFNYISDNNPDKNISYLQTKIKPIKIKPIKIKPIKIKTTKKSLKWSYYDSQIDTEISNLNSHYTQEQIENSDPQKTDYQFIDETAPFEPQLTRQKLHPKSISKKARKQTVFYDQASIIKAARASEQIFFLNQADEEKAKSIKEKAELKKQQEEPMKKNIIKWKLPTKQI